MGHCLVFPSVFKNSLLVLLLFSVTACSTKNPELLENNNPDKYTVAKDVLWASPDGFDLTMDIYVPASEKDTYPVLIIFHGGGWLINDKSIMQQASKYLATNSDYVVCNVNYRLLGDLDNTVTLDQIVEDVFGAVLWVKDHIGGYHGDNTKIAVTGDSAGGLSVQAAILSYDVYQSGLDGFESWKNPFWLMGGSTARGMFGDEFNASDNPDLYKGVSPTYHIPNASERRLPPQLLTAGRPHAFLDSGSNVMLGLEFEKDAPPALDVMVAFLDKVFYK